MKFFLAMLRGLTTSVVKNLNNLPADDGISDDLSPASLVLGTPSIDFNTFNDVRFGTYVMAYNRTEPTSSQESRGTPAIALYPSGNAQGTWYYMSLETGARIHRYHHHVLPLSQDVINKVHEIAAAEGQTPIKENFKFTRKTGEELGYLDNADDPELPPPHL